MLSEIGFPTLTSGAFLNQKFNKQTSSHEKQKTLDSSCISFCTSSGKRQIKTSWIDTKLCQLQLSKSTSSKMLHKFSAWTHLSNFDQSEHKIGRGAWSTRDYGEKSEKHLSFPPVFLNNWLNFRVWGHFEIKMLIVLGHSDINTKYFIRIFKKWACDHLKTSNLSADNFKKILDLDGSTPEPAIRSGDTGQRIPCFDSCQLITTLMCNQFSHGLPGLPK